MTLTELIASIGWGATLIVIGAVQLSRYLERKDKLSDKQAYSRLDDTETLRELNKEDRELLRLFQTRNDELTKANIKQIQENAEVKTELALVKKEMAERMADCTEKQSRTDEEIRLLKESIRELRDDLLNASNLIAQKDAEIDRLKSS